MSVPPIRPRGRRSLRLWATLIVGSVIAWYAITRGEEFGLLLRFNPRYLAPLVAVVLGGLLVNGLVLRILVRRLGVVLRPREWFGLTVLHGFGNYLPIPQAGSLARAVYLKQVHGLGYGAFTGIVLATYVQFVVAVGAVGLVAMAAWSAFDQAVSWPLVLAFLGLLLASGLLFFPRAWLVVFPRARSSRLGRWMEGLSEALAALREPRLIASVAAYQVLLLALNALGLWASFEALGIPIHPLAGLTLALVTAASGIVNVTPGNLGVAEASAWVTARLLAADGDEAIVAFTLYRIVSMGILFSLMPFFVSGFTWASRYGPRSLK